MKRKTHYLQSNKVAYYLLIAVFVMLSNSVFSQGAAVNTTGASADPSAVFDASSNTQGLLIPRMTTAERNAIVNPAEGLQIYNLDCHNFEYFNGTLWVAINPIIASVSISATPAGAVCTGTSVIFTASPVNGGTSPSYQWKLNGADVGTNSNTYTNSSLNNGDQISCELTSNANCVGGNPAFSNVLTMLIAQPPTAADAGTDQSLCNVTTATLSANTPSVGIGSWSVVSGTATITNPSSPTSGVTGLSLPGTATLLWTISNSPCSASADDVIITTNSCFTCGVDNLVDSRDANSYQTVQIGTQCWMKANLNYTTANSWCYDNNSSNCNTYGRLYTWDAATTACPSGWHLPSDAEWKQLEMHLGMSQAQADANGFRGTNNEGGNLKATILWNSPNIGATNSSGFTALPSGYRHINSSFIDLSNSCSWWSATDDLSSAWGRDLSCVYNTVYRSTISKGYGVAVRCLKD